MLQTLIACGLDLHENSPTFCKITLTTTTLWVFVIGVENKINGLSRRLSHVICENKLFKSYKPNSKSPEELWFVITI